MLAGAAAGELNGGFDIEKWPAWLLQEVLQYFAVWHIRLISLVGDMLE